MSASDSAAMARLVRSLRLSSRARTAAEKVSPAPTVSATLTLTAGARDRGVPRNGGGPVGAAGEDDELGTAGERPLGIVLEGRVRVDPGEVVLAQLDDVGHADQPHEAGLVAVAVLDEASAGCWGRAR